MRKVSPLLATLLAYMMCMPAHGAVTCVLNKDSKKFENSAAKLDKDGKAASTACDDDVAKQTLDGVQLAINSAGAKLVNPTVIVNTEKLPLPAPAPQPAPQPRPVAAGVAAPAMQPPAAGLTAAKVDVKPSRPDANSKLDWVLKANYNTLEEALEDFAARVDYEVVYEAREFPLDLKRDITIARGATFWEALTVLGDTYRKSDGAFQVQPTKFKQIVILPMSNNADAGQK